MQWSVTLALSPLLDQMIPWSGGGSCENQSKPRSSSKLFKDNGSKLGSPQACFPRGQYVLSAKLTVNNASNGGLPTGHGKGETGPLPSRQHLDKLKGKKTWAKSPVICGGRLESFQRRKVTEILRDCYCIATTYWPNALNFNTAEPFVSKSRGHEKPKPRSLPPLYR